MGTIGNLAVNVTANTEKFSRGMKKAREDASMFSKGTDQLKGKLLGLGAVLAGAFAAKFSIDSIRQAADELDRLGKSADTLGASTMGLGGLSRAADLAGSSGEAMAKGMSFMERAVSGGSSAIKDLGLDIGILRHQRPEAVFLEIADAMKLIEDNGKRLQFTKDIFGKGGEGLLPTMLQGSDSLRREMAIKEGFSRDDIKGVEEANDSGKRLSQTFKDLNSTLAIKFAPTISRLVDTANHLLGGVTPEDVKGWEAAINSLNDPKFAQFRTRFGKAETTDEQVAVIQKQFGEGWASKFLGPETGNGIVQRWQVNESLGGLGAAMRERDQKILDGIQKRQAMSLEKLQPSGMSGNPFGMMDMANNFLMGQAMKDMMEYKAPGPRWSSTELRRMQDTADDARASTPMGRLRDYTRDSRLSPEPGNAALEQGTAAAFSQSRRSQQASSMLEINKKQLNHLQNVDKGIQSIDKNIRATQTPVTVNIA